MNLGERICCLTPVDCIVRIWTNKPKSMVICYLMWETLRAWIPAQGSSLLVCGSQYHVDGSYCPEGLPDIFELERLGSSLEVVCSCTLADRIGLRDGPSRFELVPLPTRCLFRALCNKSLVGCESLLVWDLTLKLACLSREN